MVKGKTIEALHSASNTGPEHFTDEMKRTLQFENMAQTTFQKQPGKTQTIKEYQAKSRDMNRQFIKKANETISSPERKGGELLFQVPEIDYASSNNDKIICLIKTNEPHLKRAVERRSKYWMQNNRNQSTIYDVKFEFQDQPQDYSAAFLRPCQLFNHFQYNTEITTKSGLCKTLYSNTYPGLKTDTWFPRCYDLS